MTYREKLWVCLACGKYDADRMNVGDASCYLNSVEVWKDACDFSGERVARVADDGLVKPLRVVGWPHMEEP